MAGTPFFLSHHSPAEYDRCWRVGGLHLCARCLGLYPVLVAAVALQVAWRAPLTHPLDWPLALPLVLPAVLDWAASRFWPVWGSNALRTLTGVLLGLALGRSLYVHLRAPFPPLLLAQAAVVGALFVPVLLRTYIFRRAE